MVPTFKCRVPVRVSLQPKIKPECRQRLWPPLVLRGLARYLLCTVPCGHRAAALAWLGGPCGVAEGAAPAGQCRGCPSLSLPCPGTAGPARASPGPARAPPALPGHPGPASAQRGTAAPGRLRRCRQGAPQSSAQQLWHAVGGGASF